MAAKGRGGDLGLSTLTEVILHANWFGQSGLELEFILVLLNSFICTRHPY